MNYIKNNKATVYMKRIYEYCELILLDITDIINQGEIICCFIYYTLIYKEDKQTYI